MPQHQHLRMLLACPAKCMVLLLLLSTFAEHAAAAYCNGRGATMLSTVEWSDSTGVVDMTNGSSTCTLRVWDQASIEKCLDRAWVILFGPMNTYLSALQLLSLLGVPPNGTRFNEFVDFSVRDFVVENGAVIYANGASSSDQYYTSANTLETFNTLLGGAPAPQNWKRTIRVTVFAVDFWEQMDGVLDVLECSPNDDVWFDHGTETFMISQIGSSYEQCSGLKLDSCAYDRYKGYDITTALSQMQTDMERNIVRFSNLCATDRGSAYGCVVMTSHFEQQATWNSVTESNVADCLHSDHFRFFDLASFSTSWPLVGGLQDVVGLTWTWMSLLSSACATTTPALADGLSFVGDTCWGTTYSSYLQDMCDACSEPSNCSSACVVGSTLAAACPEYMATCGSDCHSYGCILSSPCEIAASCTGDCQPEKEREARPECCSASSLACPIQLGKMCTPQSLDVDMGDDFSPVDGGVGRACRGNSSTDNSESYYSRYADIYTLEGCKERCAEDVDCKGVEWTAHFLRCEVWTKEIETSVSNSRYVCLNYTAPPTTTTTTRATTTLSSSTGQTGQDDGFCRYASQDIYLGGEWTDTSYVGNTMPDGSGTSCMPRLYDQPAIEECMSGTWMVLMGGSNTALMMVRLLWMLGASLEAEIPREVFSSDVFDVIVEDGELTYRRDIALAADSLWDSDSDRIAIESALLEAPAPSGVADSRIRVTIFRTRFWDQVDAALGILECHAFPAAWSSAPIFLHIQVSAWYVYCVDWKESWCPYTTLKSQSVAGGQATFQSYVERISSRLDVFTGPRGRGEKHGASIVLAQDPFNDEWTLKTIEGWQASGCHSHRVRLVRTDEFQQNGSPFTRMLAGHADVVSATWQWMLLLGGACTTSVPAQGNTLSFDSTCSGTEYEEIVAESCAICGVDTPPCNAECMSNRFEAKCSAYISFCGEVGGCRSWECVHSTDCAYRVECDSSLGSCTPEAEQEEWRASDNDDCTALEEPRCEIQTTVTTTEPAISGFLGVNGGTDRACRGDDVDDNLEDYYITRFPIATLDLCQTLCEARLSCVGIEYWSEATRCELWDKSISVSVEAAGFECYRYFRPSTTTTTFYNGTDDNSTSNHSTTDGCARGYLSPLLLLACLALHFKSTR
mmetsp:Transcript_41972/g.96363  ORF Transcript_41972/g.96363 Transcript_41972/m.96363 type:complete len:1137 (-) Transcript_41972:39-3449(-)